LAAPAAVAGLVAAARTVNGPTVHDSLVMSDDAASEVIVVAGSANRVDTPRQEISREWIEHLFEAPGYNMSQLDRFTVWSEVAVINNDGDIGQARQRCYEITRDWGRAIEADVTLGQAVDHAWISQAGWKPRVEAGALALLLVGVTCEAFTGA
jgi:hypothetical protein